MYQNKDISLLNALSNLKHAQVVIPYDEISAFKHESSITIRPEIQCCIFIKRVEKQDELHSQY